jgi:DDE superfamily endonuclease
MITKQQYIEYLLNAPVNYTCSNLAEHLEGVSHDAVSDFLQRGRVTANRVWELVEPLLDNTEEAVLIVDDSVQNKQYSQQNGLVQRQYSGAEHGLVRGIDIVNLVHYDGQEYYPIDYRIYAPKVDGNTKNDLFGEMLMAAKNHKGIKARTVLFDSWYSSVDNLKLIAFLHMVFFAPIKDNRLVSLSREQGYIHLQDIDWTADRLENGVMVKLKELPFLVRLFKIVATNGDIDWIITNYPDPIDAQAVQDQNVQRWPIEQFHRELKQLTGSEKCQCRKARSQRNHLGSCYLAWLALKVKAQQLGLTLYQVRQQIFDDFLTLAFRQPPIQAYLPAWSKFAFD